MLMAVIVISRVENSNADLNFSLLTVVFIAYLQSLRKVFGLKHICELNSYASDVIAHVFEGYIAGVIHKVDLELLFSHVLDKLRSLLNLKLLAMVKSRICSQSNLRIDGWKRVKLVVEEWHHSLIVWLAPDTEILSLFHYDFN